MNTLPPLPDDARLHAWLDDELDPEARAEVDTWLHAHPADALRVQRWAADQAGLRQRLDAALAPPDALGDAARLAAAERPAPGRWPGRGRGGPLAQAAALALVAGLAGLAGFWAGRQPEASAALAQGPARPSAPWLARAAAAHAVYTPEKRHPVEVEVQSGDSAQQRAQEQHLAGWLTKRLDLPVRLFDLRAQGFSLVGGRLLPDANAPGAQLMYQDAGGQRVTVYLRRPDSPAPAAFRYEQVGELGLFYWVEDGAGYALVGALPRERLLALADALYAQGAAGSAASR